MSLDADQKVKLLQEYFFSRTDRVAVLAPWGKPCPADPEGALEALLKTHILGEEAEAVEISYANRKSQDAIQGCFRVGSYTPALDGKTRWLCIDLDGKGHADALEDPDACVHAILAAFQKENLLVYLERSGGGAGWHVWTFFDEPVAARKVREVAFALIPGDLALAAGGTAKPRKGKGIEVFPKQNKIRKNGYGNLVWLPWWSGAAEGGNDFYALNESGEFEPYTPDHFDTVGEANLDRILKEIGTDDSKPDNKVTNTEWEAWRNKALESLPLEKVYGEWLTGRPSGDGWLQCRDPSSPSGDQRPSAGVSEGTSEYERGAFHSFISGITISVFDFLMEQGRASNFHEACQLVAEFSGIPVPHAEKKNHGDTATRQHGLPIIQINNRQLRDKIVDAWKALRAANAAGKLSNGQDPFLFVRSGALVRLIHDQDEPRIEYLNETATIGLLARVADWIKITNDGPTSVSPDKDVARDLLVYPHRSLPPLEAVMTMPVFGKGGTLIAEPGYHQQEEIWLHPDPELRISAILDKPTPDDVQAARSLLLDNLLVDFPFRGEADRTHAVAAMILPFVRRMIEGCTPLHLIEAPTAGSGKGLLSNLIAIVATGSVCDGRTLSNQEDESRKMITAELSRGKPIILLDNINTRWELNNPVLASVITAETWTDRILGVSTMVTLPNRALWLMTANNPKLSMEIARRCVRIRIDPGMDRPWQRSGFKHIYIQEWAREHRSQLVHAVLVLARTWIAAGCPLHENRLGSFEHWSAVMGGILDVTGIPGFLGNLDDLYEEADAEGQMWRDFVEAWWNTFEGSNKKVSELNEFCDERELMTAVRGDQTDRSQQTRLGKALSSARDRVFNGFRVTRIKLHGKHKGSVTYALIQEETDSPENYGDVGPKWGRDGDVEFKRPHDVKQNIEEGNKNHGDVGDVTPRTYAYREQKQYNKVRNNIYSITPPSNVPNVPRKNINDPDKKSYTMGTLPFNVPTTSPTSPDVPMSPEQVIDLSQISEPCDESDKKVREAE